MFPNVSQKKNIYLDYAAATPVDPLVKKVMEPFLSDGFGNPSSLYKKGREARMAVEDARKKIADIIGARPGEIIFTAGGTESCNLAIFGVSKNLRTDKNYHPHIITSAIEHHAVLNPAKALKEEGYGLDILDVNRDGEVNINDIEKMIRPETSLVSIMYANNEIGTIEPIAEIGKLLKRINTERERSGLTRISFHTDACQAAGFLDIDVNRLSVDLMSVNGSKIYGPKQTGFLFVRNGINLKPIIYGGGQERDLRSGTENVAGIVGLAKALELSQAIIEPESNRIRRLVDFLISKLLKVPGVTLNGPSRNRLPNNINVTIKGVEGEALMLYLDSYGVEVSTGSACATGSSDASHVLLAIGRSQTAAKSSIRLSLGRDTSKAELDYVIKILIPVINQLRKTSNQL
ncbi:MAG: cysteine desulfurase family protein [Candidatus Doudnabacteria bacterium]|nr:cysteine desulfurase family protein [Candidatus Doudnabacteria bacterium]